MSQANTVRLEGHSRSHRSGLPVILLLSASVTSSVPRITWLFLPLVTITLGLAKIQRPANWKELIEPNCALILLSLISFYFFLSTAWAVDPGAAFLKATVFAIVAFLTIFASRAVDAVGEQQLNRAGVALVAGLLIGAFFLVFEVMTNFLITRMVINAIPMLKHQNNPHVRPFAGDVVWVKPSVLKENAAILTMGLWPGLLALSALASGTRRLLVAGLLFAAVAAGAILAQHHSSMVAVCASLLVFILAQRWLSVVIRGLAVIYCLAFALVLPVDFAVYNADLHLANWLPSSFRARIIIWEYTAERTLERPVLGIGAASTPAAREPETLSEKPEGYVYPRNTGRHAHDVFLQIWYELGAVGVILSMLAGAALILRVGLLPAEAQPFAAAFVAVVLSLAAFAWSMWETWLMFGMGLSVFYLNVASQARTSERRSSVSLTGEPAVLKQVQAVTG